ncbi:hypothetical protein AHOnP31_07270 [Aeromonas hydrophila]|uniref:hypothetical protein n=1 Tax=Aeromonas hydrophila TaxID=644 RepID=UPI001A8E6F14|nr:hypothetical protein [Aeromonas hydrophila]QSR79223.1 hypothetical protein AHOnP31_07270 [Aeromonas hydrophila]UMQ39898.1 hypothetical protein MJ578_07245 [Aeromonas hydrophila]UMQ48432.1 hypothetical protein MJ573_07245 [Aeromonas hydrophila]
MILLIHDAPLPLFNTCADDTEKVPLASAHATQCRFQANIVMNGTLLHQSSSPNTLISSFVTTTSLALNNAKLIPMPGRAAAIAALRRHRP